MNDTKVKGLGCKIPQSKPLKEIFIRAIKNHSHYETFLENYIYEESQGNFGAKPFKKDTRINTNFQFFVQEIKSIRDSEKYSSKCGIKDNRKSKLRVDEHIVKIGTFPLRKIPFFEKEGNKEGKFEETQLLELQRIKKDKEETKNKLNEIERIEERLMGKLNNSLIKERSISEMRVRSEFSNEEKKRIKEIKFRQNKFEEELIEKERNLKLNEEKSLLEEKHILEKGMREINEKKKEEIKNKLLLLQKHKQERSAKLLQDEKRITSLYSKRRLYSVLETNWEKQEMENKLFDKKKYEERKKESSVDLECLKEHSIRYEEILRKNREEFCRKRAEANEMNQRIFKIKAHQTRLHTILLEEENKRKADELSKKEFVINLIEKKKEFSQSVKICHPPKQKVKSEGSEKSESVTRSLGRAPLEYKEHREVGLKYLKESKNKIDIHKSKETNLKNSDLGSISPKKQKYNDYLYESRISREKKGAESIKVEKNYNNEVEKARKIMKESVISNEEKVERIKLIAESIENNPGSLNSESLIKKIQAKMEILETLS